MSNELSKTAPLTPEEWVSIDPPESEVEYRDEEDKDGKHIRVAFIPIWIVERLITEYAEMLGESQWDRFNHQYSFVEIGGDLYLATSFELKIFLRTILCSSCIWLADYPNNSNWLQTGIAEATKAGVKILGNRFGAGLNDRKVLNTPASIPDEPIPEEVKNKIPAGLKEKLTQK